VFSLIVETHNLHSCFVIDLIGKSDVFLLGFSRHSQPSSRTANFFRGFTGPRAFLFSGLGRAAPACVAPSIECARSVFGGRTDAQSGVFRVPPAGPPTFARSCVLGAQSSRACPPDYTNREKRPSLSSAPKYSLSRTTLNPLQHRLRTFF